jgi:hypothetical protein
MTDLELYELKHNEFLDYVKQDNVNVRKMNKMQKTLHALAIEINKENHCYYDNEVWITNLNIFHHPTLTGNELTIYVANELNKLNGVMLEKEMNGNNVNYIVYVITPYSVYEYILYRGYNNQVNFEPYKICGTHKHKSRQVIVKEHICELVFTKNLKELLQKYDRYILEKGAI